MTKEISITIEGQQPNSEEAPIIMTADGQYHLQNEKHYIQYEEPLEEGNGLIKNLIKLSAERIEMTKKGAAASQMSFDIHQSTEAIYQTPYGHLCFRIITDAISIEEAEDRMTVVLEYALYSDHTHISDHRTVIRILPKNAGV